MIIEREKIEEAKEKLGDQNAEIIAETLQLEKWDTRSKKALCPFHDEDTPSFIYNPKTHSFHCFGCQKNFDIIDAFISTGKSYIESVKELFSLAEIEFAFSEEGVQTQASYRYPHEELPMFGKAVSSYMNLRGISDKTLQDARVTEDPHGNIVFNYYDTNDVLTLVKYRPSHKIDKSKGEQKSWCQKDADTLPLLFHMNHVNTTEPLLITEGECFTGDAEVLTERGWMRLSKYVDLFEKGEHIKVFEAEENPNHKRGLSGSFVYPYGAVRKPVKERFVVSSKAHTYYSLTTPKHQIVTCNAPWNKDKPYIKQDAESVPNDARIPVSVYYRTPSEDEIYDENFAGCFYPDLSSRFLFFWIVTAYILGGKARIEKDEYGRVIYKHTMQKDTILDAILATLGALRYAYKCQDKSDSEKILTFLISDELFQNNRYKLLGDTCHHVISSISEGKSLDKKELLDTLLNTLLELGYYERYIIFASLSCQTTGYLGGIGFNNCKVKIQDKDYLEMFDTFIHLSQMTSKRSGDVLKIIEEPYVDIKGKFAKKRKTLDTTCYCVSVPTGMILVRQNGYISVSGNCDTLAAIEAGYHNAVSVPFGAGNFQWITENFEWLEQFDSIILCPDNDEPGQKMKAECITRLGSWRTRYIDIPDKGVSLKTGREVKLKDLNDVLYHLGKNKVLELINSAEDPGVPSVLNVSEVKDFDLDTIDGIETGIKELDAEIMRLFYGTLTVVSGTPGCVDKDTEYFNGTEWKKISEYTKGEKVLQYNPDGTAELVTPLQYHVYPCERFYHLYTTKGIDQMLSDEHNVVYITSKGNLQKKPMREVYQQHCGSQNGFSGLFIPSFDFCGEGVNLTDAEIRLMCAVIADGSFDKNVSSNAKTYGRVRLNLKKARKKERVVQLLNDAGCEFEEHNWNKQDPEYTNYVFYPPIRTKTYPKEWYGFSNRQKQVFVDEVLRWDGHIDQKGRMRYSTTIKENADFVQFMFASSGYKTTISTRDRVGQKHSSGTYTYKSVEYEIQIAQKPHQLMSLHHGKEKNKIDVYEPRDLQYKYCFTVPSGMLVLRRNNDINITGNSGKTSFLSQLCCEALDQEKPVMMFSREMPNWMQKNWLTYIMAGNRHIKQYEDHNHADYYRVTPEAKAAINKAYDKKCFLYKDDYPNTLEAIMSSMEDCVRKFGVKLVILDNLMTIDLGANENNSLLKQTECINKLISFAAKYAIAVVLVAHPRKMAQGEDVGIYDVSGSSNIINLAHRSFGLRRIDHETEKDDHDVKLTVIKDRMRGKAGKHIAMYYDPPSRRFYTNPEEYNRHYAWDTAEYTDTLPYPHADDKEIYGDIGGKKEQKN